MELKRLTDLFWMSSPNIFCLSFLLASATGILNAMLIPFVLYALSGEVEYSLGLEIQNFNYFNSPTSELAIVFLFVCIFIITIKTFSMSMSAFIACKASKDHRLSLYQRINQLSPIDLEKIGQARLLNHLNMDVPAVTVAAINIPFFWGGVLTILGTMSYLLYLNFKVFVFVFICLIVTIITYQIPMYFASIFYAKTRNKFDLVQEGIRGLIYGYKELKLNQNKFSMFYENELASAESSALNSNIKARTLFIFAESYGGMISFLVIGVTVFHLRFVFDLSNFELFSIVMALIYLIGPVGLMLNIFGPIREGKVSLNKLKQFYLELKKEDYGRKPISSNWNQLVLSNLTYNYPESNGSFSLKSVNAKFKKGQISFIIGGNGSGKSTLAKCLSLHYMPESGSISFGNEQINKDNLNSARQSVTAIYGDFFLFSRLYGCDYNNAKLNKYLKYLELDNKVNVVDGVFSTTKLSDGQRKRLSLLVLLLEDRKVCVFDEWAADQDPRFKKLFYSKILSDLKEQNKVIIVISHDDRYFHCADQIITMEDGGIRNIIENQVNEIGIEVNHQVSTNIA